MYKIYISFSYERIAMSATVVKRAWKISNMPNMFIDEGWLDKPSKIHNR
jgi:hypothetical protein